MRVEAAAEAIAAADKKAALGALPQWDLSDLYPGPDSAELNRDLVLLAEDANAFRQRYEGRLAGLSGAELGAAVEAYERMQELSGRIISYASLVHAGNLADPEIGRFYQTMQERTNAIATGLLFFTLELNRLDDDVSRQRRPIPALGPLPAVAARCARLSPAPAVATRSKSCCTRNRSPAAPPGPGCSTRPIADLRFPFRGRDLTEAEAMHLMSDRDGAVRREAALSIGEVLGRNARHLRADHQHARQGQGDRGPLAPFRAADLVAQPVELCRGRGRRRADRGGAGELSRACRIAITG